MVILPSYVSLPEGIGFVLIIKWKGHRTLVIPWEFKHMGVSENSVPLNPMVFMIIIPFLNGYFIGNINPTFSDKPRWCSALAGQTYVSNLFSLPALWTRRQSSLVDLFHTHDGSGWCCYIIMVAIVLLRGYNTYSWLTYISMTIIWDIC